VENSGHAKKNEIISSNEGAGDFIYAEVAKRDNRLSPIRWMHNGMLLSIANIDNYNDYLFSFFKEGSGRGEKERTLRDTGAVLTSNLINRDQLSGTLDRLSQRRRIPPILQWRAPVSLAADGSSRTEANPVD